ncbi:MAG: PilN domain-containing protein [Candidatus Wallbacteria bacterium]|nr:PilN domain-containing protein [Candidatus Wallbacteria bacterium]
MRKVSFNLLTAEKMDFTEVFLPYVLGALILTDCCLILCTWIYFREIRQGVQPFRPDLKRVEAISLLVKEYNDFIPGIGFRMGSLFSELEKILPDGVLIKEVSVNPKGLISLKGESKTNVDLKLLLERLSRKPFSDALVENQKLLENKIIFRMVCSFET